MVVGLGLVGIALCDIWRRLIKSFGQLNAAKFAVILEIEKRLPARIFAAEWASLQGDPIEYVSFTKSESRTARVFIAAHSFLVVFGFWLFRT